MQLVTENGETIALGKQVGPRGGEGAVYELSHDASRVAKIYHRPPPDHKVRKLRAMTRLATTDILRFAAWPTALIRASSGGQIAGIVMRKIAHARQVHELETPSHRRAYFPHADWRFLIRTARNCAAAVASIHKAGFVIGDVNQGGFLVTQNALVNVIDCDSFQVQTPAETFLCEVAVPEFLPPELHGVKLSSTVRSPNHDAFGLAIVIFRLLMMGRHPFAGYRGKGDKPIPDAIREFRFAFGADASALQMAPPPHSLLLSDLSREAATLFLRAFSRGSEHPNARPAATEWVATLDALEKQNKLCSADPGHYFFAGSSLCPWCRIEKGSGPNYFISVTVKAIGAQTQQIDVGRLWAEVTTVVHPDQFLRYIAAQPTKAIPAPLPPGIKDHQQTVNILGILAAVSCCLMLLGFVSANFAYIALPFAVTMTVAWATVYRRSPLFKVRQARRLVRDSRHWDVAQIERDISQTVARLQQEFAIRYTESSRIVESLRQIEHAESHEMQQLQANARQRQLEAFLDGYFLRDATIRDIGSGRVALLESYGIESANDVTERGIAAVPGFGPKLTQRLMEWRMSIERNFRFDPAKGLPQADVARIRTKYLQLRHAGQKHLQTNKAELVRLSDAAKAATQSVASALGARRAALAQANADLDICY